jgi:S1-C subfamily serine protease
VTFAGLAATGNIGGDQTTTIVRTTAASATPAALSTGDPAPVPETAEAGTLSVQEVVRRTSSAITLVSARTEQGEAFGSGFLVDRAGRILTNEHVVGEATTVTVTFADRSRVQARVLGVDPSTDLAVLQAERVPASARPVPLGQSEGIVVGDGVVALGNPFGLERTATTGIVSALKREIEAPNGFPIQNVIQTDAAINKGNSGGPLLDRKGRVIGINSQIASEGGGSDGIGFTVPIDTVRPVADAIIATGEPRHAWIGITGRDIDPELAEKLGMPGKSGVVIESTDSRGPARAGGVRSANSQGDEVPRGGDIIVAIDGRTVSDMADVSQRIASRPVGARITVTVLRDGDRVDVPLTLADRPDDVGIR